MITIGAGMYYQLQITQNFFNDISEKLSNNPYQVLYSRLYFFQYDKKITLLAKPEIITQTDGSYIIWQTENMPKQAFFLKYGCYGIRIILQGQGGFIVQAYQNDKLITIEKVEFLGDAYIKDWQTSAIALIGLGHKGYLMAESLIKMGVKKFYFIDMEVIKPINIEIIPNLDKSQLGHYKAQVIAENILKKYQDITIEIIHDSITSPKALGAIKAADILIQCSNQDISRLAVGIYSAQYFKPYLDISIYIENFNNIYGYAYLFFANHSCIWCAQALYNPQQALKLFSSNINILPSSYGNQKDINILVVKYGVLLLQQFFTEKKIKINQKQLETFMTSTYEDCPLCQHKGTGDSGLACYSSLARRLQQSIDNKK